MDLNHSFNSWLIIFRPTKSSVLTGLLQLLMLLQPTNILDFTFRPGIVLQLLMLLQPTNILDFTFRPSIVHSIYYDA